MSEPIAVSALPAGARLLHIGLTKTGTTALQSVASLRRADLLRCGVRYPGKRYNHRQAAFALQRRGSRRSDPRPDEWDELQAEIAADPSRRVLISNEFIADWDETVAARFAAELGPRTHVVITLRSFGALLPSIWQQYVKSGYAVGFEDFLGLVLARGGATSVPEPPQLDRHDQGAVVTRWAGVVGPERLTVIIGDKSRPRLISDAFEALLELPPGLLHDPDQGGSGSNRSLSAEEAGLLLSVNRILRPYRVAQGDLVRILRRGATARFLDECAVADPASTLSLPPWAADAAAARGREFASVIERSGVAVIGDLDELSRVTRDGPGRWTLPGTVDTDVAAQALTGAMSGALRRGPDFGAARPVPTGERRLLGRVPGVLAAFRRQLPGRRREW